ncbi:MAG: endopeptidase La [Clostridia bacterium]|nr:endopeptidase La [Clostridia bacterium]
MENYTIENEYRANVLPVIPLRGKVAFPQVAITFEIGRERTVNATKRAMQTTNSLVFIVTQKDTEQEDVQGSDLFSVGCVAKIKQASRMNNGATRVICQGLYRAKVREISEDGGCFMAVVDELSIKRAGDDVLEEAYLRTAKALAQDVLSADGKLSKETLLLLDAKEDAESFMNMAFSVMRIRLEVKQSALEETDVIKRLRLLDKCLNDELEIAKVEKKIANAVRQSIDKSQKEYFLREQVKAIHKELGDDGKEEDEFREKIKAKNLPKGLEEKCLKEVDRMQKMQPSSPEYTVISGYLEQVLSLPWTEETQDTNKLSACQKTLDADHYGLNKIKERITEYLAVLKLTGNMKAPILCLVGPPGVGKTSIAQSIARALNRKFVRMSLGGVKDEAEIRGHRRTYIGAMPGRILYGMKQAGSINPVFLLDEIDKITSDMHGDPASALLEALDPEQNSTFRDRYLEYEYDLSKVLFLATANTLDTVPTALRDRMEIIELTGYTVEEKTEIAKRYLVPKQSKANGIEDRQPKLRTDALRFIIEGYTREAGVRTLERTIGSVCRKLAVKYANDEKTVGVITPKQVETLLGKPRFKVDESNLQPKVGAVTGLAWTAVGGSTLVVEAVTVKGKGEIKLTGHLGDVMRESAQTALSYIRANAQKYGLDGVDFEKTDLHIHVPEGATPKDGPSAGITMATAILSAFTGKAVRGDVAMTGEVTLRGNVLPIGGLREKALSASRTGIKTVIVPYENAKDVDEILATTKCDVEFRFVKDVEEVFAHAFA